MFRRLCVRAPRTSIWLVFETTSVGLLDLVSAGGISGGRKRDDGGSSLIIADWTLRIKPDESGGLDRACSRIRQNSVSAKQTLSEIWRQQLRNFRQEFNESASDLVEWFQIIKTFGGWK